MADEKVTIANITPVNFDKYIMSKTLGDTYQEDGQDPILVTGPTENWKIIPSSGNNPIVELHPPYVRRVPEENSMILDMVDSNMKQVLIEFQDGSRIDSLKFTPNPESLVINSSKIITRYNTMTRWVEEHWGDDIDSINLSGNSYSFNVQLNSGGYTGLNNTLRNSSEAYQFLKYLIQIYRTNGYLYQEKGAYTGSNVATNVEEAVDYSMVNRFLLQNPTFRNSHPRHGMIRERLYNRISFDYLTVIGYFESFDITEDSGTPYKLLYNTVFKAEKTIWMINK